MQWATGGVGLWNLRKIIDHPDLELAGVLVYPPDKAGRDAGDLCGRPKTGVTATLSKEAIVSMDADVVIMTPKLPEDDDLIALLRSGKDLITPLSHFAPEVEGAELMSRIESACHEGGSTLYGAGIDPGFVCDRVPAVLTDACAEVERGKEAEARRVDRLARNARFSQSKMTLNERRSVGNSLFHRSGGVDD